MENKNRKFKKANNNDSVILVIGEKVWQAPESYAKAVINLGLEKFKKEKQIAIIGLYKNGIYHLKKDIYKTVEALMEDVDNYNKEGYKVYYYAGVG